MSSENARQKLLLLGDSLTQFCFEGWGKQLANTYQRRADVVNRGMSGYNTRWYMRYADDYGIWTEILPPTSVKLVTLWFGANDAATLEQHVPLDEYATNLETMVAKTHVVYPEAKILIITPPPVAEQQRQQYLETQFGEEASQQAQRTNKVTKSYAEACKQVALNKKVPCLDLFSAMMEETKKSEDNANDEKSDEKNNSDLLSRFFYDGLHFSEAGHDFVWKELSEAIRTHFPSLEVQPCAITGQFNNSSSTCQDLATSGPYHDTIKKHKTRWREAFDEESSNKKIKTNGENNEEEQK